MCVYVIVSLMQMKERMPVLTVGMKPWSKAGLGETGGVSGVLVVVRSHTPYYHIHSSS